MAFSPIGLRGMGHSQSFRHEPRLALGSPRAVLETPAFVASLDDVAVMGEAVEQGGGHLGVAESFMMPPFWNASCVGRAREGGRFVRGKDRFATVAPWRVDG